ncbi:MAG: NADPH-dependent 7-cyano-7-deazaguanine reductase QueF [Moraxellaceae bacterium]
MSIDKSLLGQQTDYPQHYAPEVLFPISRAEGRAALDLGETDALPFKGVDLWTHYEVSWLNAQGKPVVAAAEIQVPATSPFLIESKSLKLYFNSLNFERFADAAAFLQRVETDLSHVAGAAVTLTLVSPAQHAQMAVADLPGCCLDDLPLVCERFELNPKTLQSQGAVVEETLHSHLLRSNCPVTNQPDWGSVLIRYRGPAIDRMGLLAYLVSYRQHADFHEQCVERIFMDVLARCRPEALTVYARYTRRGGLDINPWRSTESVLPESVRLFRQ